MASQTDRPHAPRLPRIPSSLIRRAFTLTELLVVITIIAILAGMAGVAVVRGLDTAKQTRIKAELDSIDAAFKAWFEAESDPLAVMMGMQFFQVFDEITITGDFDAAKRRR